MDNVAETYFEWVFSEIPSNSDALIQIAADLFGDRLIAEIREDLERNNRGLLERLTRTSSVHMLGFSELTLWTSKDNRKAFSIHSWNAGDPNFQRMSDVHSHRFSFDSYVVTGSLLNRVWTQSDEGTPFHHYWYLPAKDSYTLECAGTDSLVVAQEKHLKVGDSYSLDHDELHTATPGPGFLITLFVQNYPDTPKKCIDVYSRENKPASEVSTHSRNYIQPPAFLEALRAIEAQHALVP